MRLPGLIGQHRAVEVLTRSFDSGRFHPSLLFHGPAGSGKLTAALTLARALLCAAPEAPCGNCSACRRIDAASLRHPDVRVVFPEPLKEFEKGESAEEGVAGFALQEDQAEAVGHPGWSVLIDRVRASIAVLNRHPAEGTRSVLIVDQAHRMSAASANALLKTLEEPPAHAVIVLLTPTLQALLPTIRSRCRAVPFQAIAPETLKRHLIEVHGLGDAEAGLRAALSGGRFGTALAMDLEAFCARREEILRALESFLRPPDAGLALARAEEFAKGEHSEADLEILATLLRDRMILGAAGESAPGLIHRDILPRLRSLALRDGLDGTSPMDLIESALESIRRMGHRQIQVEHALLGLLHEARAGVPRPAP